MKYSLNMVVVAMILSACTALNNGNLEAVSASEVVAVRESASDVVAPTVPHTQAAQSAGNDVTVLPITSPKIASDNTAPKNDKNDKDKNDANVKVNVTLRNPPKTEINKKNKIPKTPTPATKTKNASSKTTNLPKAMAKLPPPPPPKPVLTRRQVLEQEIARERAALQVAKNQLAQAKKSGNAKTIAKLNAAVQDRELNVRAIENEMKR